MNEQQQRLDRAARAARDWQRSRENVDVALAVSHAAWKDGTPFNGALAAALDGLVVRDARIGIVKR